MLKNETKGNPLIAGGHFLPPADNTYDLGSSSKEWKDLHVDGTAYIDRLAAVTLGGTVTLNSQVFGAGSGSLRVNTTGSGEGLDLYSTNDSTNGVRLSAYQVTTSPAVDDVLFEYYIYGNATGGAQKEAATLRFLVEAVGATTLAGKMAILLRTGSAWNEALALSSAGELTLDHSLLLNQSVDSAAVADEVRLTGYDVGVDERALAISQEAAIIVETDETKFSHKMPVRINGTTYFMMLTQS